MYRILNISLLISAFLSFTLQAQDNRGNWSVRGGYARSIPNLDGNSINLQFPISVLGIKPINSYYFGLAYSYEWSRFGLRTELNYQRKGMTGVDVNVIKPAPPINEYHYIGVTPTISFRIVNKLIVYLGPEINLLVAKKSEFQYSHPVEVGLASRIGYRLQRAEINLGIVAAFNSYAYTKSGGQNILFYKNTSLQAGLTYRIQKGD